MSVGVPQIAKVQLLDETMTAGRSDYYSYSVNRKLTEQAEYAFTTIYNEVTNASDFFIVKTSRRIETMSTLSYFIVLFNITRT